MILGERDRFSPSGRNGAEAWDARGLVRAVPLDAETTAEVADILQELWQSWPIDSLIGDPRRKTFGDPSSIKTIDHHGRYDVDGPLSTPTTPQGQPVTLFHVETAAQAAAWWKRAEIVIVERSAWDGAVPSDAAEHRSPLLVAAGTEADPPAGAVGVLLRSSDPLVTVSRFLDDVNELLDSTRFRRVDGTGTARSLLGLPVAPFLLAGHRAAFSEH